jgi:hypothetical protein
MRQPSCLKRRHPTTRLPDSVLSASGPPEEASMFFSKSWDYHPDKPFKRPRMNSRLRRPQPGPFGGEHEAQALCVTPNAAAGESMTLPRLDPRKRKALRLFGRRKCPSLMNSSAGEQSTTTVIYPHSRAGGSGVVWATHANQSLNHLTTQKE